MQIKTQKGNVVVIAMIFVAIYSLAGWFFGMRGNMKFKKGPMALVRRSMIPAFCPISISPIHKAITPAMVIHREIASPALSNAALVTALMLPVKAA